MSRFTKQITSYWQQFRTVVRNEYGSIFTDAGVILVLVLALLIYSTLYSLAYGTQVLRNVPIGVIDMSNTSTSRQLINTFNAGPNVYVAYEPGDMDEAKHLFYDREIYGVVYIPSDYEEKLLGGQQAVVSLYIVSFPDQRSHGGHHRLSHPVSAVLYFPGHRRLDAVPAARTVDHAVALVFDPGSDAQRSFRTPRSDA